MTRFCCCSKCCFSLSECCLTFGIINLIFATIELVDTCIVLGDSILKVHYDEKHPSENLPENYYELILVLMLALYVIGIVDIVLNVGLIIAASCSKDRKLVLIWFFGTIILTILLLPECILYLVTRNYFLVYWTLLWIGLNCYFLWVGWLFQKELQNFRVADQEEQIQLESEPEPEPAEQEQVDQNQENQSDTDLVRNQDTIES